jgi:hypothetical protein
MDLKTIHKRVETEGQSFLTITLPAFASDFQKSLDQGFVDHSLFKSFSFSGGLPRFLGGFLDLVFDRSSGRLLDSPSIDAIFSIQQITMLFGKIQRPCAQARVDAAIDGYIECEQHIRTVDSSLENSVLLDDFHRISRLLWSDLFSAIDLRIYNGEVIPKHGPGATAEKVLGNKKYYQNEWPSRLDQMFPYQENIFATYSDYQNDVVNVLEPGQERPSRLAAVPKTMKTPRLIAIEPIAMQYMQQGILEIIEDEVERFDRPRHLISWKSQVPNQELARIGSVTGDLATLDLSEASDRVSNQLVRLMLSDHPHFASAVDATRSRKVDVPGYGVQRLAKFASMGSALCFPVESLVFMTVIFVGIEKVLNRPLTKSDVYSHFGKVRTYGDDIIVPVGYVDSVVESLQTFGFKVNSGKSFWTGKFRESCGKFYYDGEDISVTRMRRDMPTQRKDARETVSLVSMRNLFYKSGMWKVTSHLDEELDRLTKSFGWRFPKVLDTSPLLGRHTYLTPEGERYDEFLQRPLVKGIVMESSIPVNDIDGSQALLKFFLKRSDLPFADRNHLERSGRPDSVRIKVRWGSIH